MNFVHKLSGIKKMTLDEREGVGVWEVPQKDEVIYEQPLFYKPIQCT